MKTKIKHSLSKNAWNVVADEIGCKYKIAHVPYQQSDCIIERLTGGDKEKADALKHALFISSCFNNMENLKKLGEMLIHADNFGSDHNERKEMRNLFEKLKL